LKRHLALHRVRRAYPSCEQGMQFLFDALDVIWGVLMSKAQLSGNPCRVVTRKRGHDYSCTNSAAPPATSMSKDFHLFPIGSAQGQFAPGLASRRDLSMLFLLRFCRTPRIRKRIVSVPRWWGVIAVSRQSVKIFIELCRLPQGIEAPDAQVRCAPSFPPIFAVRRRNCAARKAASEGWEDASE